MLQRTDGFDAQSTVSDCTMSKKIDDDLWSLEHETLPEPIAELTFPNGDGYIRDKKIKSKKYEKRLEKLQIELVKLQRWVREKGERVVLVFEGRDAAGKGGTIRRFMLNLNPRYAHVVALSKPSDVEQGQWYFQRYIDHLPTTGDMCFYDRSWYNRAGVERVFGFCTEDQVQDFFMEAPVFEGMLQREGIHLFKFWLTVERAEQLKRFYERKDNPLKQWKLSPIDHKSVGKWDDYTRAIADMFRNTDTPHAPWTVLDANDQKRARLNAIRVVLNAFDYDGKDEESIGKLDKDLVWSGQEFLDHRGW
jgi:polyphosphate kinase 2